ncbi:MAG TPA: hypothetical protein ENI62_04325 [Gammaproteobacteria bacterium]|nr:hypothetical protein [Gammaproteobacteria bacterium]
MHLRTFHPGHYILRHWQGLLPLWVSVVVNLVALRILASLVQPLLSPPKAAIAVLFAYVLFAHIILLVWQVVGVLRAAERYSSHSGFHTPALGAQIIAIMAIILTLPQYMDAYHSTLPPPAAADYLERMDREHAAQYVLQVSPDGRSLSFSGLIALGATRRVRAILLKNTTVRKLLITSKGGNIYEARGIAKAVMDYSLATHAIGECSSACTLVFAAGRIRTLAPGAQLGFHQYRLEQTRRIPNVDPGQEQERDRKFFLSRGFSDDFVARIFQASPVGIWFPNTRQLLSAHAIQRIDVVE